MGLSLVPILLNISHLPAVPLVVDPCPIIEVVKVTAAGAFTCASRSRYPMAPVADHHLSVNRVDFPAHGKLKNVNEQAGGCGEYKRTA